MADVGVKSQYTPLVREAANGDRHAMEQLLARAQQSAYRFGLRVCGDSEDAEDAMQEALLKTYQHVHQNSITRTRFAPGCTRRCAMRA